MRITILALAITFTVVSISFAQIPSNGLVAYFPFNGNANDASGNLNNGIVSGASLTTDRFGVANKAYSFNGQNNFISVPNSASLLLPGSFTISLFFKYSGAGTSGKNYWTILNKNQTGGGNYDPFHIFVEAINDASMKPGQIGIRFADGIIGHERLFESKSLVNDGSWHHIAFAYDSIAYTYKFYVDNNLDSTMNVGSGWHPTTNDAPLTLGNWSAYDSYFNGSLDDIRIYNRALSQSEISFLYTEGATPPNNPPGFISTPDTLATEDQPWSYTVLAVDVDAGDTVAYSLRTPPLGMTISGNKVSWTPTNANVGSNIVTIRAMDSRGAFSDQTFRVHVINVNDPPAIISAAPTAAVQNQVFQYQAQASDPDVGDVLTWQLTTAPQGMTISASGLVTWTPTQAQVGSNNVVIQVRDVAGATAQQSFSITVTNVNDAPVITDPTSKTATEDVPFSLQLTATDPDGNQVFWFVVQGPDSLKIEMSSGLLTWTPRQNVAGSTVQVKIRATDAVLSDTTTFSITVTAVNDPPVITTILPTQFKLDTLYSIPLTATDEEGDAITWSVPRKPATMNIIGNILVWAPTTLGLDTITIIATDGNGFDTLSSVVQVLNAVAALSRMHSALPISFELSAVSQRAGTVSVTAGLPANAGMGTITIFSISGKKVAEKNIAGAGWHALSFGNVSTGAHLLRLNAGGKSIVRKVSSF
jgi:Putative Ig domain.